LWGCTTLKIGKPSRDRSSVTPLYTSRLHWMLIPDPLWYGLEGSNIYNGSGISLATLGVAPVNVRGLIPGPLNTGLYKSYTMSMDLGSVSTGYSDRPVARAIKIKHAGLNLTGHRKDIMNRQKILIEHWRWLQVNGYKQQAASCKLQALDLTRKQYRIIREYESKRSIKNYR